MLCELLRLHLAVGWSWLLFGGCLRDLFGLVVEALGGRLGDALDHILVAGLRRLLGRFGIDVVQWSFIVDVQGYGLGWRDWPLGTKRSSMTLRREVSLVPYLHFLLRTSLLVPDLGLHLLNLCVPPTIRLFSAEGIEQRVSCFSPYLLIRLQVS